MHFGSTNPSTSPSPPFLSTLIYTPSAPAPAAVHDPAEYLAVAVHRLQPLWAQRLGVGIVRLVDYCQELQLAISHPKKYCSPVNRAKGDLPIVPQILHEMADRTSNLLILVCRERYHWLFIPNQPSIHHRHFPPNTLPPSEYSSRTHIPQNTA